MNLLNEKISNIVTEVVERQGFFLIELVLRGTDKKKIIEVYIDNEKDVSAEDCALVSREINSQLETLTDSSYRLDVSSPGVDRPLKYLKQFPKHINRKFEISYTDKKSSDPDSGGETKKFSGKLIGVDGDDLIFLVNNQAEKRVNFNNIKKAKVIVSFS